MTRKTMGRTILAVMMVIAVCWGLFGAWLQSMVYPGPLTEARTVILPKGAGAGQIAQILADNGIVARAWEFRLASRVRFADQMIKAGEYAFEPRISMHHVFEKITGGNVIDRSLTIPEGRTFPEIKAILMATDGLYGPPLAFEEGALLPQTYHFRYGDKVADVMRRMARDMTDAVNEAWANRAPDSPLKSPHELLVLASIIEKETGINDERGLVASVFVNRLKKGMRLQADPTVIYGATDYAGRITRAHLLEPHPYNTYVHHGLPPGPICSPGRASLLAAANPTPSDYLYFVADGNGGHIFSRTYEEHRQNVDAYVKLRRAQRAAAETGQALIEEGNQ